MKEIIEHGEEINVETLKNIQMDILAAIDEFCHNNNIKYSMGCGTMLGAIRHKGYIPWDDDIDIYMLREDYNNLMHLFPEVYKERYCIKSLERNSLWDFVFAKAYDNRTITFEAANYNELYGVNIDIFPIDDVPNDEIQWLRYNKKRRRIQMDLYGLRRNIPFGLRPRDFARWIYYKTISMRYTRRQLAEYVDSFCQMWNKKGYNYVFECSSGFSQKNRFRKEIFNSLIKYPFEDREFMGFENYDEYLRNGFGDYMQLPPKEKRIAHHHFKTYWKEL